MRNPASWLHELVYVESRQGHRRSKAGALPEPAGSSTRRPVSELEAENARLRRELADAKLDVEIIKKAAAYFAKVSR